MPLILLTFSMIPPSLHNKEYVLSYDEKYDTFPYNFLCFSAALIASMSNLKKLIYRFFYLNSSFMYINMKNIGTRCTAHNMHNDYACPLKHT